MRCPRMSMSMALLLVIYSIAQVSSCHESCSDNAFPPQNNDGIAFQMFVDSYEATGVASVGGDKKNRVVIKSRKHSGKSLDLKEGKHQAFNKLIKYDFKQDAENQLVWIRYAGSGYVSIIFWPNLCIGSGHAAKSKVYVVNNDNWCKDSKAHHFAMSYTDDGDYVTFRQAQNGLCLTSDDDSEDIYVDYCDDDNEAQHWLVCNSSGEKCNPCKDGKKLEGRKGRKGKKGKKDDKNSKEKNSKEKHSGEKHSGEKHSGEKH